ncbi:hypothetical protein B7463_g9215, partial [Scytalidium lignicola]
MNYSCFPTEARTKPDTDHKGDVSPIQFSSITVKQSSKSTRSTPEAAITTPVSMPSAGTPTTDEVHDLSSVWDQQLQSPTQYQSIATSTTDMSTSIRQSTSTPPMPLSDVPPLTGDIDFDLIWPDSEVLFQTIVAPDTSNTNPWLAMPMSMPLTFPLSEAYDLNNFEWNENHKVNHKESIGTCSADDVQFQTPNSSRDRGSSIDAIPRGGNSRAVDDVSRMVASLSSSVTAAVEATSITSMFLDECLHMFFVRFIPTFPILHRATFVFRDCTQPLLLNAIAIGSLYRGPKDSIAKGEVLWRLAHIAVATSWEKLITHRGPYDACKGVQLVLAALLGQIYGALSRNREIRTTSQAFHALGFFWARHCGMFDSEPYSLDHLPSLNDPEATKDYQWRVWAAKQIQLRALLGHYTVDGLMGRMFGRPTSIRHAANRLGLPCSDALFEANSADEWLTVMNSEKSSPNKTSITSFRAIFHSLFQPTDYSGIPTPLETTAFTALSLRVVLEGLQTFVSDSSDDDLGPAVGVPPIFEIRRALVKMHHIISLSQHLFSAEKLELLLRWHGICLDICVDSSILCKNVCSRYGIAQYIWAGSGGEGELEMTKNELDLIRWAATDNARRALLHAIAIQEMIEQLPRGRAHVTHIPTSLFAAATVYVVLCLGGLTQFNLPSEVEWKEVLLSHNEDPNDGLSSSASSSSSELSPTSTQSETRGFISDSCLNLGVGSALEGDKHRNKHIGISRNLLYELNSMQKLFRCLSAQWGISFEMEEVMDKWIGLCHR